MQNRTKKSATSAKPTSRRTSARLSKKTGKLAAKPVEMVSAKAASVKVAKVKPVKKAKPVVEKTSQPAVPESIEAAAPAIITSPEPKVEAKPIKRPGLTLAVNRKALLSALELAGRVANGCRPKPILGCVKLSAIDDGLLIEATDIETSIRQIIQQVQIENAGIILVPCDQLLELVKRSDSDVLNLTAKADYIPADPKDLVGFGESVLVVCDSDSSRVIPTPFGPEDFPMLAKPATDPDLELPAGNLQKLIERTAFAVSKDNGRYAFNGLCIVPNGNSLKIVGTDGRRLAYAALPASILNPRTDRKILSARAAALVAATCKSIGENAAVRIRLPGENRPMFSFTAHDGLLSIESNELEGQFPPFEDVIPKGCDRQLEISPENFAECIRKVGLASSDTRPGIRLDCNLKGVALSAISSERGLGDSRYPARFIGAELAIGFNVDFLAQGLEAMPGESAVLELSQPNRPGFLHGAAGADDFGYVVMPVNLQ